MNDLGSILSGETNNAANSSSSIGDLVGSILGGR
jgi:hypothetical protein